MHGILCSISKENVEVARAATDALIAGDAEAALNALHPDVEWHGTVGGLDEGHTGTVNTVPDGLIVRARSFMERREALRAAGLQT